MGISIRSVEYSGKWFAGETFELTTNETHKSTHTMIYECTNVETGNPPRITWMLISDESETEYGDVGGLAENDVLDGSGIVLSPSESDGSNMSGEVTYWNNLPDPNYTFVGQTYTYIITTRSSGYKIWNFDIPSDFPAGNYYLKYAWIVE